MTNLKTMKEELLNVVNENAEMLVGSEYEGDTESFTDQFISELSAYISEIDKLYKDKETFEAYKSHINDGKKYTTFDYDAATKFALSTSWILAKYLAPSTLKVRGIDIESVPTNDDIIQMLNAEKEYEAAMSDDDLECYIASTCIEISTKYDILKFETM